MKAKSSNVMWGAFLIVLGIIIAGKSFDLWDFNLFFRGWWTLFIIIPSIVGLIQNGYKTGSVIWLVIGLLLLLSSQGFIESRTISKLIVPLILVLIGCNLLLRSFIFKNIHQNSPTYTNNLGETDYTQIFSARKVSLNNDVFTGATINSIFGGLELDLRNSIISENIVIECVSIFGGATILLPSNTNIKVSCIPIFGGISNISNNNVSPDSPTIFFNATCIFGGVDLK